MDETNEDLDTSSSCDEEEPPFASHSKLFVRATTIWGRRLKSLSFSFNTDI
jgi:hypothetical protein